MSCSRALILDTRGVRGFTLVELLVVLVLIGIILSFAVLSVGGGTERELEQEARRLAALVSLAEEESVFQSRETGILFTAQGYAFYELDQNNVWQAIKDEVLRPRTLPSGMVLGLAVESLPVKLDLAKEKVEPQVFLLSGGERTPFEATIGTVQEESTRYRVLVPIMGDIQVEEARS